MLILFVVKPQDHKARRVTSESCHHLFPVQALHIVVSGVHVELPVDLEPDTPQVSGVPLADLAQPGQGVCGAPQYELPALEELSARVLVELSAGLEGS